MAELVDVLRAAHLEDRLSNHRTGAVGAEDDAERLVVSFSVGTGKRERRPGEVDPLQALAEFDPYPAGGLGGVEQDRVEIAPRDRVDDLVWMCAVGLQREFGRTLGVDHPALHRDGDGIDPLDRPDVDEGHDSPRGQGEVDRAARRDVGPPDVGPALVQHDVVAGAREIGGEQRAAGACADNGDRAALVAGAHRVSAPSSSRSRIPTKRWMSPNEL